MNAKEWARLSPGQQQEAWAQHHARLAGPPPGYVATSAQAARGGVNVWGAVAMTTAVGSWLLLPVLLGVVGLVCAIVGDVVEHRATGRNSRLCVAALFVAGLGIVLSNLL